MTRPEPTIPHAGDVALVEAEGAPAGAPLVPACIRRVRNTDQPDVYTVITDVVSMTWITLDDSAERRGWISAARRNDEKAVAQHAARAAQQTTQRGRAA